MLKPLRSNPLLDQTLRAGRWPSLWMTLVFLIALLIGATAYRDWLNDLMPDTGNTRFALVLPLLLLWLLPLITMAIAAASTAHRLRDESFQLVRQSTLTDCQVTWGLGLSTLYNLRVVLVLAFGLLPALIDDILLGGVSMALCLAGLHLAASMLGTVLVLRWGRQRLGVVLAAICCILVMTLLLNLNIKRSPFMTQVCSWAVLNPARLQVKGLLLRLGLRGPFPTAAATILPILLGWLVGFIPWRGQEGGRRLQLELSSFALAAIVALGAWIVNIVQIGANERQVLVALYQTTGGKQWFRSDGWLSEQPICSWYGIMCACGHVIQIDLTSNNLQGKVPSEIGQLSSLDWLDLFGNELTDLPPEIGRLSSLYLLDLSSNQFLHLPPEIGQLTGLERLDLESNPIAELPPEIGQLASLRTLYLRSNQLSKLPPEIGQLANLRELYLWSNQLSELPPEIGQLANLTDLDIEINQLTELPPEIGQLTSLWELNLRDNQLSVLPLEIDQLTNLRNLWLADNSFVGLPPEICQMPDLWIDIRDKLCDN